MERFTVDKCPIQLKRRALKKNKNRLGPAFRDVEAAALHTMAVEATGDWIPRLTTLLIAHGQAVFVRMQGSASNQQLCTKWGRSVSKNSLSGIGTCTKRNLLELTKRDERVNS